MRRDGASRFARRRLAVRLGRLRWALAGVGTAAVAAALVWVIWFSTWLAVDHVEVRGQQSLTAHRIRTEASVAKGTPLARVDTGAVESRVEQVRRVEKATVQRAWPQTLSIEVTERTAVAVVDDDGGTLRALDRHGVVFKHLKKAPKHLPEVTVTAHGASRTDALQEVAAVVTSLDPAIARKVEHVEAASMDAIVLELRDGDEVNWGTADESRQKARVLKQLLKIPAETYDVTAPERPTTQS